MADFFKAGGAGMYPVMLFGFLALASAVLYLLRPERRYVGLMVALGVSTFASGLLGFAAGMVNVLRYVAGIEPGKELIIISAGASESLHVVLLALTLIVLTSVVASVGAFRASRRVALPTT